ncbi:MAG: rhodanese-like domain-containing protein [Gammaproteobacteria bacterium]|nr:rhodanese-like domain-containing protein [Gammaproteobacteria bacterium]
MKKLTLIIAFALFTVSSISGAHGEKSITAADLDALIVAGNAPLILDVRSQDEFASGHIPGAVNIPHTELEARIAELDGHKNNTIVLHCRSGRRAVSADAVLHRKGFTKITELEGHMLSWEAGGHPVE